MADFTFLNASAPYTALEDQDASIPLVFDRTEIGEAVVSHVARVFDPRMERSHNVSSNNTHIVYARQADGSLPERAYWVGHTMMDCIFGSVKLCDILRRVRQNDANAPWELTQERAAVKVLSRAEMQRRHAEDPIKEVDALHYLARAPRNHPHPNCVHVLDALQNDEFLHIFMPYYSSGGLDYFVFRSGGFSEPIARYWFRQILQGLAHLHENGVCHRDMSLENVVIDANTRSAIIDLGMCLRIPYHDDATGGVTDVTHGSLRRLIKPSGACGKLSYIAPEILRNQDAFDGFAIDLWGAAVMLFIMLVGQRPWQVATMADPWYRLVARWKDNGATEPMGRLIDTGVGRLVLALDREISPLAADLLQRMLRENPRQRLSLIQVQEHPWVLGFTEAGPNEAPPTDPWRN